MQSRPSVIMLEFNELTPRLMDQFMGEGQLPNFQRFYRETEIFTTDAECEGEDLNPWVQWVTVHTGLPPHEHGAARLTDGHKLRHASIWDLLSKAGYRVWVCGSMNAAHQNPLNGHLLPDPWTSAATSYPAGAFDAYYNFVRTMVQEHTNRQRGLSKLDALKFMTFMAGNGLSPRTIGKFVKQLGTEKIKKKGHWKRSVLLDELQYDLFQHHYRKYRPDFATFFLNSTAHFQHVYWRAMEPDVFETKPSAAERAEHQSAILFGYQNMDALVGRFLRLARPETTLIMCTGLSQQPYLKLEATGGKHFYRIKGPEVLKDRLGLAEKYTYHPVMSEQFALRFEDTPSAERSLQRLRSFRLGERDLFLADLKGLDLMVQCAANDVVPQDAQVANGPATAPLPFFDIFYKVDSVKSGFHHPDGMLWIRRPTREHTVHVDKVSLCSIAPAILDIFAVPRPQYMAGAAMAATH